MDRFFAGYVGIEPSFIFDGSELEELTHRLLWGPSIDMLLADEQIADPENAENTLWTLGDHLGTLRDIADFDTGTQVYTITNHRVYDSFGNLTNQTNGSVHVDFAYTGKFFDGVTGLSHHWNRWYDPALGKWISEDPIGFAAGDANLSRYAGNRVIQAVDPTGLDFVFSDGQGNMETYNPQTGESAQYVDPEWGMRELLKAMDERRHQDALQRERQRRIDDYHRRIHAALDAEADNYTSWSGYWDAWSGETPRVNAWDEVLYYGGRGGRTVGVAALGDAAVAAAVPTGGQSLTGWSYLWIGVSGGYALDQTQSGVRSMWSGEHVDSFGGSAVQGLLGSDSAAGQIGSFTYDNAGLGSIFRLKPWTWFRAPRGEVPSVIYREGRPSSSNLTPRPQDHGNLSFRDSLSNPVEPGVAGPLGGNRPVFRPGEDYMAIDTSKLPPGSVVPDGVPGSLTTPPGHVSVSNVPPEVLKDAVIPKPPKPPYGPDGSGKFPK